MAAPKAISYTPEETARLEIRSFINEGLEDVRNQFFYPVDEAFDEIEGRYTDDML